MKERLLNCCCVSSELCAATWGRHTKKFLCALVVSVAVFGLSLARKSNWHAVTSESPYANADYLDSELSFAAAAQLGKREGTVIVIDPRSGRVRAVVNPQNAFGLAFAPGSTIKPFSTLAALRSGLIKKDSRILCREHYFNEDFETVCSHPTGLPPLGPTEAIAYSCNYYFGKLGEQLRASSFNSTLAEFGFGQQTGINWNGAEREAAGKVHSRQWRSQNALGESDQIQVTPIQLLTAYSALVNGGRLFVPRIAPEKNFVPQQLRKLEIEDQQRQLITEGMRGSIRYGTAERARLHLLPLYVLGKTGTSTQIGGFRTQGWFVGLAYPVDGATPNQSKSDDARLAVLVFLKRGHGSDAAELARPIFEAYVRAGGRDAKMRVQGDGETGERGNTGTRGRGDTETRGREDAEIRGRGDMETRGRGDVSASAVISASPRLRVPVSVRVHLGRERVTRTMTLEDYILGVVATEGGTETEPEALKALAVATRSYALKNRRRHENEGYDFCTTTHCQRYRSIDAVNPDSGVSSAVFEAVRQTTGEILHSDDGQVVDSYFSASCGGATANISTLWGVRAPSHLTGGPDEFCLTMPHHSWTDEISFADLHRALRSDPRTDIGKRLTSVVVVRQDRSGRAESIRIDGQRRRIVTGWDFKIIIGRALGWNLLKSSRFEIKRSGSGYVFRGSGFGHGLGLCQEGAHVMARRGATYQQILAKYFPTTNVRAASESTEPRAATIWSTGKGATNADLLWNFGVRRQAKRDAAFSRTNFTLSIASGVTADSAVSDKLKFVGQLSRPTSQRYAAALQTRSLASEHFRVSYPETVNQREAEHVLRVLESSRDNLIRRVSAAGVSFQFPALELVINKTTGDFVGRTGQPPWAAAATRGNRIELQPLELLKRRRILETTLRHELVHAVINSIDRGRTPRWLSEGLAIHFAGEGPAVSGHQLKTNISIAELEQKLSISVSAGEMRAAYAAAYEQVQRLISAQGEAAVWRQVSQKSRILPL